MPCFVFISGYLSKDPDKCRDKAFKSLFVPYIIMSFLWEVYCAAFAAAVHGYSAFEFGFSLLNPAYGLWYLQALFIWRYFLKDILKIKHVFFISICLSLSVGLFNEFGTMFSMSRVIVFLPFFLAGYYSRKNGYLTEILSITKFKSALIVFAVLGTALCMSFSDDRIYRFLFYHCSFDSAGLLPGLGIISRSLFLFISSMMIVALLKNIPDKNTKLTLLGKNSMLIYVGHFYMANIFHSIFYSQAEVNILLGGAVFIPATIWFLSSDKINTVYKKTIGYIADSLFTV